MSGTAIPITADVTGGSFPPNEIQNFDIKLCFLKSKSLQN